MFLTAYIKRPFIKRRFIGLKYGRRTTEDAKKQNQR